MRDAAFMPARMPIPALPFSKFRADSDVRLRARSPSIRDRITGLLYHVLPPRLAAMAMRYKHLFRLIYRQFHTLSPFLRQLFHFSLLAHEERKTPTMPLL